MTFPIYGQVKDALPLLEQARQSALALHQLPVDDPQTSRLLTDGLERLDLAWGLLEKHLDKLGAAQGPLSKADRNATRLQAARVEYLRGELYRLTAIKRKADDPTRQTYLDSAVLIFSQMRKNYRSIADAELARIGLSRCYRLLGQFENALKILAPITRQSKAPVELGALNLWRAALIEQLEILLVQSPQDALNQANHFMEHAAFVNQSHWQKALKNLDARAAIELAFEDPEDGPVLLAATKVQESSLSSTQKLKYTVQLELASGIPLVSPQQRHDWVLLLVDILKPQQAVDRIAEQVPNISVLNAQALLAYGSVLWQSQNLPLAVDCFGRALRLLDETNPLKNQASLWYAQCLFDQARQGDHAGLRMRAREALSRLVQMHPSRSVKRTSLKQWLYLEHADKGLARVTQIIKQYPDLLGNDPYLHYLLLSFHWQQLNQKIRARTLEPAMAFDQVQKYLKQTQAMTQIALSNDDQSVAAGLLQLQAKLHASSVLQQPMQAIRLLDQAQQLTGESQVQLKTLLLIENNLTDLLWDLLEAEADAQLEGKTWVLIIETFTNLAQRKPNNPMLPKRTNTLIIRAWNNPLSKAQKNHIAQSLIRLRSWDVCLTLLGRTITSDHDPQLNLIIGQALLGQGKDTQQTIIVLSQVANDLPDSSTAHLWLAMAYAKDLQHPQATTHYRQVRRLEKPATLTWWHGTLGLAQSLSAQGQNQAARELLKITLMLYPVVGDDALAQDMIQLMESLHQP